MVEVESQRSPNDDIRLLIQAASIVRFANLHLDKYQTNRDIPGRKGRPVTIYEQTVFTERRGDVTQFQSDIWPLPEARCLGWH